MRCSAICRTPQSQRFNISVIIVEAFSFLARRRLAIIISSLTRQKTSGKFLGELIPFSSQKHYEI
jgi:hypothetical protein